MGCWEDTKLCLPDSIVQPFGLPYGKYQFDFFSRNTWREILELSESEGVVTQTITITREELDV